MLKTKIKAFTLEQICFGMLLLYIAIGYFANDVILPTVINSVVLFLFLGIAAITIISKKGIKLPPILIWGGICLFGAFVAMLYSPTISVFSGTYYKLIVNFILVFILSQLDWNKKRLDYVFSVFTSSGALLIILLSLTGNLEDESGRLGEKLTGNANILAIMLMMSAIYGFWLIVSSSKVWLKIVFILCELTIYFGMFLSGGRKYVVVPIIFLLIIWISKTDKKGKRHALKYSLITLLLFGSLFYVVMKVPMFYETIGYRFEGFFSIFDDSYDIDGSTDVRIKMIKGALCEWINNPIFGHGFDSFKYFNRDYLTGYFYYSHNNFVELLYNQGIVGFAIYYSMYVYLVVKNSFNNRSSLHRGFVFGAIIALLIFDFFEVTYSISPVQFFLFFSITLLNQNIINDNN